MPPAAPPLTQPLHPGHMRNAISTPPHGKAGQKQQKVEDYLSIMSSEDIPEIWCLQEDKINKTKIILVCKNITNSPGELDSYIIKIICGEGGG